MVCKESALPTVLSHQPFMLDFLGSNRYTCGNELEVISESKGYFLPASLPGNIKNSALALKMKNEKHLTQNCKSPASEELPTTVTTLPNFPTLFLCESHSFAK